LSVENAQKLKNFPIGVDDFRNEFYMKNRKNEFADEIKKFCLFRYFKKIKV
jgi:hypothetical protein